MADTEPRIDPHGEAYFSSRYSWDSGRNRVWQAIGGYLQRWIPLHGAVLDLGAGYCAFINNIRASEKQALDIYPGFTRYANSEVKTHVGTCTDLSRFESKHFDVVFASNLLEHLTRDAAQDVLREARRILKPEGCLILVQPNFYYAYRNYFDDPTHLQIYTHLGLAEFLITHGYRVEKMEPRFVPFSFKSHWPTWGWLAVLYLRLPFRPFAKQMMFVARPAG
jgi:SAM-dependent methyltransferase